MSGYVSDTNNNTSGNAGGVVVSAVDWKNDRAVLAELFTEFYRFITVDQQFVEGFGILVDAENLPGPYAAPEGAALLAWVNGEPAGCFCLKPHAAYTDGLRTAEAKRMFIRPAYRGLKLGSALLDALLTAARSMGYQEMLLDSLRTLEPAHRLYYSRGFTLIPAYNAMPPDKVLHMHCAL